MKDEKKQTCAEKLAINSFCSLDFFSCSSSGFITWTVITKVIPLEISFSHHTKNHH